MGLVQPKALLPFGSYRKSSFPGRQSTAEFTIDSRLEFSEAQQCGMLLVVLTMYIKPHSEFRHQPELLCL
jgi:hypothetical protein